MTLQSHFEQTLTFFLLLTLCAAALCLVAYARRVKRLRDRERQLTKLVDERTRELKETEQQFRRSRDELEVRIQERTIELVSANHALANEVGVRRRTEEQLVRSKEAAEQANQAKSEFLANMSHELRTPINGILGMTDAALNISMNDEQREYLGLVKLSAETLLRIIVSILDFASIENEQVDLEAHPFSLAEAIDDVTSAMSVVAKQKGLALVAKLGDLPAQVIGDRFRCAQVLTNLLDNAIKFTSAGRIGLSAQIVEKTAEGILVQFSISDSGIGIPMDKQATIFEPFNQADNSSTREHGGTGLGLTISSEIAGMMGGCLWLESTPGTGSTFHVTMRFRTPPVRRDALASPEYLTTPA